MLSPQKRKAVVTGPRISTPHRENVISCLVRETGSKGRDPVSKAAGRTWIWFRHLECWQWLLFWDFFITFLGRKG